MLPLSDAPFPDVLLDCFRIVPAAADLAVVTPLD